MDVEADEDLLEPRRRSMSRRHGIALVVAAAAVAAVATVVLLVHNREPSRQDAAPTRQATTPTTSSAATAATRVPPPPKPACLDVGVGSHTCGITPHLPRSAVAAVQRLLPGATVTAASTFIGRDGAVYSRRATLRATDGTTLQLQVGPRTGQSGSVIVPGLPEATVVQFATDRGRSHVELVVRTPAGVAPPDLARLRSLAADPRLLAVR